MPRHVTGAASDLVDVRRAADRFRTRTDWLDSRSSFSFGPHYDPGNTAFGRLVAHNDDVVRPGTGFDPHPHRDVEVVTWVLEGALVHEDSTGHRGVVHPGLAQRMSAGTGVVHSERNDAWRADAAAPVAPVRFVQMWVRPDESGVRPGYEQRDVSADLAAGGLVTVASGMPRHRDSAGVHLGARGAALHAARPAFGTTPLVLPEAPRLHLYVARGTVHVEGVGELGPGDALRLTGDGGRRVTAATPGAAAPPEVLLWELHDPVEAP